MKFDWASIYRPKTIAECILPQRIKGSLLSFEARRRFPHLMFYGEPGLGKTTAAEVLAANHDTYRVKGSTINDLKDLRQYMSHYGFRKADIKIAIIDEASRLKPSVFPDLNVLLEADLQTAVIATLNDPTYIVTSVRSRFIEFDFTPRPGEDEQLIGEMTDRCEFILAQNDTRASRVDIESLVRRHYPDFRQVIKHLYLLHLAKHVAGLSCPRADA